MPLLFTSNPTQKIRRNSNKMTSSTQNQGIMLPYRDENNTSVAYAPSSQPPPPNPYDSDAEPLVPQSSTQQSNLSDYDMQHFTATGRPQPAFKASGLANLGGHMYTVPQLLPKRYTDDSIIPAIITDVVPSPKVQAPEVTKEKKGLLSKLKGRKELEKKDKVLKVVYMPRKEYLKWFARDEKGEYIGTEEHRRWTEEELEREFGKYKPETGKMKKDGLLSGTGSGTATSGALNALGSALG